MVIPKRFIGEGGVTYPSPNEWPITYREITGITRALQAIVTSPDHGFTSSDIPETVVDFTQVKGMQHINGQFAALVEVIDTDNFTVALNTSNYHAYTSGGFVNIISGNAPYDPFQNLFP